MYVGITIFQDATESDLENMLSDNFDVTLSDMQVLIADKGNPKIRYYCGCFKHR